eukprot:Gb_16163 [translate_table: standard]
MESRKASKMVDIVRRWHKLASSGLLSRRRKSWSSDVPADVPEGHLAVYVGRECKRFVIQTGYINHPLFRPLLEKAEEEFGVNVKGPILIPCTPHLFHRVLSLINSNANLTHSDILQELHCLIEAESMEYCCASSARAPSHVSHGSFLIRSF